MVSEKEVKILAEITKILVENKLDFVQVGDIKICRSKWDDTQKLTKEGKPMSRREIEDSILFGSNHNQ